jgi:hypothetical protein
MLELVFRAAKPASIAVGGFLAAHLISAALLKACAGSPLALIPGSRALQILVPFAVAFIVGKSIYRAFWKSVEELDA